MTGRSLTPNEKRAWARVARSIRPIAPERMSDFVELSPAEPVNAPTDRKRKNSDRASVARTASQPSALLADRSGERKIRRGQVVFQSRIDLHGHTQASADAALSRFVSNARASDVRAVLVITGKGRNGEGVLRRNFLHWLDTPRARGLVSGWAPAHPKHGGAGAFYVFLRRR